MIYVDDVNIKRKVGRSTRRWFHMIADPPDEQELIEFGQRIGLNPAWLQRSTLVHFDITAGMRKKALAAGAIQITGRQLVDKVRAIRRLRGQT